MSDTNVGFSFATKDISYYMGFWLGMKCWVLIQFPSKYIKTMASLRQMQTGIIIKNLLFGKVLPLLRGRACAPHAES